MYDSRTETTIIIHVYKKRRTTSISQEINVYYPGNSLCIWCGGRCPCVDVYVSEDPCALSQRER